MELVLPCDDLVLRSIITQRRSGDCPPGVRLSPTVEGLVAGLFEMEIAYHKQVDMIKQDLWRRPDWNGSEAFKCVDTSRDGALGIDNVLSFVR